MAAVAFVLTAAAHAEWFSDSQTIMGTRVQAEVWHADGERGRAAVAAVMREMHRIDALMSPFVESSELSIMNRDAARGPVRVGKEMLDLLAVAAKVSEMTGGAFDVTYASVGRYYDYRDGQRPDEAIIARTVQAIDYRYVAIDWEASTVAYRHPEVYVDLGGIAKGYAVDRSIEIIRGHGVEHAMVAAGGDSRIIGDRRGKPWIVGVKHPRRPDEMAAVLPLADIAVSTSGDYERFFERDGVRYHHILDPATGDSARSVRSVTILGAETTFTDAMSTSVFVLGAKAGLDLVNATPGIDAIIVDGDGELLFSEGLENL